MQPIHNTAPLMPLTPRYRVKQVVDAKPSVNGVRAKMVLAERKEAA